MIEHLLPFICLFLPVLVILCTIFIISFTRSAPTVFFFVLGVLILLYGLWKIRGRLFRETSIQSSLDFARSTIARNSNRSLLCIGLIASTTFLVLSISAFRLDPESKNNTSYRNYSGGFVFIGETSFPVYSNIGTALGREELAIQADDEKFLETKEIDIVSFRMNNGDGSSCLNLYQTNNPRVLGIPVEALKKRREQHFGSFHFAEPYESYSALMPSVWSALQRPVSLDPDGVRRVPVIIDANTAMYSLHLYGGLGDVYELDDGANGIIRCEIVGLLSNSILQGDILMGEDNFLQLFPGSGGYRFFLLGRRTTGNTQPLDDRTLNIIYNLLGDYGFQGEATTDRLRKLFAVQNTYLSTFQSLGGMGLLLGMFGLAVIQSRNVLERRKELALLIAIGFSKSRVILLLLYESFTLLAWGLGLAVVASALALLPFFFGNVQEVSAMSVLNQFIILVGGLSFVGFISNVAAALAVLKIPVARELAEER